MLITNTIPFRRKRKSAPTPPAPAALVLVAASCDLSEPWVRLTFDQPIDIAAIDPSQFHVNNGVAPGQRLAGTGTPTLIDPATVEVPLEVTGRFVGFGVTLSVGPGNGIVAAGGGEQWPGAAELKLPFP